MPEYRPGGLRRRPDPFWVLATEAPQFICSLRFPSLSPVSRVRETYGQMLRCSVLSLILAVRCLKKTFLLASTA